MEATTEHQLAKPNTTTLLSALPPTDRAYLILSEKHSEQALVELAGKYVDVTEIKDTADYQLVRRGSIELMKARTAIEATGKVARDDANQFRKAVIAEERRLILITLSEESRLKALRKDYDDEQERIAAESRLAEQRRVADITERIQAIKRQCDGLLGSDSTSIQMRLDAVDTIVCNETLFYEFADQAAEVKAGTVETLELLLTARQEFEAQVEENERIAQEQAERQAQLDQQAREQEARERAAQDKINAKQAEIDRQTQAMIDNQRAEENKRLTAERAEQDRIEREKREADEADQKRQAAEADAARQEAMRPDKEKLLAWALEIQEIMAPLITDIQLQSYRNSAVQNIHNIGDELWIQVEKF